MAAKQQNVRFWTKASQFAPYTSAWGRADIIRAGAMRNIQVKHSAAGPDQLHHRADLPGYEFKFAVAEVFGFGVRPRCDL